MNLKLEKTIFNTRTVLEEQEFSVDEMTLITGISGSGKTTLLKQISSNYECGYLSQDPDNQIVCDKVWHEMAFGLENLGVCSNTIRARVAEVATYLNISGWVNKDVSELSGGQKQKVCLAAVLCMAPKLILLDEPTSMLDPLATREFWEIVNRLSRDFGIYFLIVEHNDNYVSRLCTKHYVLEKGFLKSQSSERQQMFVQQKEIEEISSYHNIRKSYGAALILNIPALRLSKGINCLVGPNGVGKTTLLRMLTGGFKEKKIIKHSVLMPQDVKIMFSKDTVEAELKPYFQEIPEQLKEHLKKHPLDLSGGEQHILGVFLTLGRDAEVYCFDEPTKGMDTDLKYQIMDLIASSEKNCIISTHDLNIASIYSNKVFFLFNREIAAEGTPEEVFKENLFYKPEDIIWD